MRLIKCSLIFMILVNYTFAQTFTNSYLNNGISVDTKEQKEIRTYEDYMELESLLKKAITQGDQSKYFSLGALYLEDFPFKKADKEKAKIYLNKALNLGYGLASLALIEDYIMIGDLDNALLLLEKGLKGKNTDPNSKIVLAVTYNGIVLDYKFTNMPYVHKALDLTYPISQITNVSSLDFSIANLLNIAGNYEEAKKYLNTACNNPNVEPTIKNACDNSMGIKNNIKKSTECTTCGLGALK
ncbi:hypothetical protein CP985_03390 [Malaciobacter mytili LMG 24559]|uniref:Beta-lactamase n=1 Tax=Malaciobacter mytili LMG 24559 TaxID=1032238 RepID=A0AAX2AKC2_9BACT|nr:hypothetical protein [Malaciobacter mytili]AXH16401.1 hypothetical protein AMYT_a0103 [Malaciobacter mytili LMG 24559]RXK16468.1 hypothetical protein CP985_03390 [Malaciobacter mytili LMG 24559]